MQVDLEEQDLASLVEFSEARAYRSLMQAAPREFLELNHMRTVPFGSAVAVVAGTVGASLNMNRVIGLGVAEAASERTIDEISKLYADHGVAFGIELCPAARPGALKNWLQLRRMRRGVATAVHYRLAEPLEVERSASAHQPVSVRRATADERNLVADICCSVFRMPEPARTLLAGTSALPEWRQWIAYAGDRPIAAALSFVHDRVAWFGWDATLPEFRGLGAQAALIATRVDDACSAGCDYITTETAPNMGERTDPSYRNYARSGFRFVYERHTHISMRTRAQVNHG
jgi:hypothetical protein